MEWLPMKPDPPVTRTVLIAASLMLSTKLLDDLSAFSGGRQRFERNVCLGISRRRSGRSPTALSLTAHGRDEKQTDHHHTDAEAA